MSNDDQSFKDDWRVHGQQSAPQYTPEERLQPMPPIVEGITNVPPGYKRITDGVRCRCARIKIIGDDAFCCGGGREEQRPAASMHEASPEQVSPALQLMPGKADAEVANELKSALIDKLEEILPILTACRVAGFVPQFQLGLDPMQRDTIISVHLIKYF